MVAPAPRHVRGPSGSDPAPLGRPDPAPTHRVQARARRGTRPGHRPHTASGTLRCVNTHADSVPAPTGRVQPTLAAEPHRHPASLSVQLARAAADLSVDGVGLLLHQPPDPWTPLAASNESTALVACLDRAVGDGPCQEAVHTGRPGIGTQEMLIRRAPGVPAP